MNVLTVSEITKRVGVDFVLNNINFTQQEFQKIAIAGESGSGKSTLLKIIAGLAQPDSGKVFLQQERVVGPDEKLIPGHPHIAYLSQHYELRNNYRVEELLSYANTLSDDNAKTLYQVCRIDHLQHRKTDQLSGGEKQRIAMARLLIASPKLFLMDEPFSNLDPIHRTILKAVINDLTERLKITCLLVSHDPLDMLSWADEILVMRNGEIIQRGSPGEIYSQPVNAYAGGLFGKYNLLAPSLARSFPALSGIAINQKKVFARPEQFKIGPKHNGAVKGRLKKIMYMGSHYELEVLLDQTILTITTPVCDFLKEDEVYVSLLSGNAWFME